MLGVDRKYVSTAIEKKLGELRVPAENGLMKWSQAVAISRVDQRRVRFEHGTDLTQVAVARCLEEESGVPGLGPSAI
jgi:hypothetical protein